jgi:hypothetical protein
MPVEPMLAIRCIGRGCVRGLTGTRRRKLIMSSAQLLPDDLSAYGRKLFSQGDEDGVIAEIFGRIGTTTRTFIEFGAESGQENNTRWLLEQGWRGLWIEGNPRCANVIRGYFREHLHTGRLVFVEAMVTAENINQLISRFSPAEVDFLSIDIDGNDYHVLEAITAVRPRVICMEYNVSRPPPMDWVMPYNPSHQWKGDDQYGASLIALERLAKSKGYELVGSSAHSANAFFVRADIVADRFHGPFTAERFFRSVSYQDIVNFPRTLPLSLWLRARARLYANAARSRIHALSAGLLRRVSMRHG